MRVLGYHIRPDLGLAAVIEDGVEFETGRRVRFRYFRFTEKSQHHGARFGQDIEPAGRYMTHVEHPSSAALRRGETGMIVFEKPLVLALTLDPNEIYGSKGWKARLAAHYRATGRLLSKRILADGYDGIVTVDRYGTAEIVDLSPLA